jgi:hypothetical protein
VATITDEVGRPVALDRIRVAENVRALDDAHVQALAGSIALQGMLVPVAVVVQLGVVVIGRTADHGRPACARLRRRTCPERDMSAFWARSR